MNYRRTLFGTTLCILILLLSACSSPEEQKEKHYLKALEYINQNEEKSAILELRNAIQIDAKYAEARYQLGLLYLKQNKPRDAFQELVRAANLDHNNVDANLKAAEFYLITRKMDESRKLAERILNKDAEHKEALALIANLELIEGNFDKALVYLNEIDDEVNKSDKLLNIRGRIYAAKEDYAAAEDAFLKAITIDSERFANYRTLLFFYQSQKEMGKAENLLHTMAEKFPDTPETHLLLAGFYKSKGETDKLEQELQQVIVIEPQNPRYRLMLAEFYTTSGNKQKALEVLTEANRAIKNDLDIRAALAKHYFETLEFVKAKEVVNALLQDEPGFGKAKLLEARFLLNEGKVRGAIEILEKLTGNYPKWAEPFFFLAAAHYTQGELDLAQINISSAINNKGNESKYHALLAQLYLVQGAQEEAKKEASTALKLKPSNLRAGLIMTNAMLANEEYQQAKEILTEINKQIPTNIEVLGTLAVATLKSGETGEAEQLLTKILEIDPGNRRAMMLLTNLKFRDDPAAAENFLREQIQAAPRNSDLHFFLGEMLLRQAYEEDALKAFEEAIQLDPDNLKAYAAAGRLLTRLGQKDEAIIRYEKMISQNPQIINGYMGLATIHQAEQDYRQAMVNYEKVLEIRPDFAPAANNLAWLLASIPDGDMGQALRLAMIAKKEAPDSPDISDTLGWVYYKRGSYTLAIPQFELALNARPDDPMIMYHLALALEADGQKIKALNTLQELLEKNPQFEKKEEAEVLLMNLKG